MPHCAAIGCHFQSRGNKNSDISIHAFPKETKRRAEWEEACGRTELPKYPCLCSQHFSPDAFESFNRSQLLKELTGVISYKRRLKPDAIPTVFPKKSPGSPRVASKKCAKKRQRQGTLHASLLDFEQPSSSITAEHTSECEPSGTTLDTEEPDKPPVHVVRPTTIMSGNSCCVKNCHQFSHDEDGKSLNNGLSFFSFPAWRRNEGGEISELTMMRRAAWVAAVGRSDITFNHIPKSTRVCSRHFHSGKPAYERLHLDPDWTPSLELGHYEGNGRYTERSNLSTRDTESKKKQKKEKILKEEKELKKTVKKRRFDISRPLMGEVQAAGGEATKGVGDPVRGNRPWSEVRSLLLSVLKNQPISNQLPEDRAHEETVHVRKKTDFRDFFRKSLEDSLENFSKSRTPSTKEPPIYVELTEDLSLRILPAKQTSKDSSSSLSCKNCVRLQRKVTVLQEELSLFRGGHQDMDVTPVSNMTQLHTDQVQQSSETAKREIEEEVPDSLFCPFCGVGPQRETTFCSSCGKNIKFLFNVKQPSTNQGAESLEGHHKKKKKLSSSHQKRAITQSPMDKPRPTLRFKKAWLRMFGFLRYSPSLNVMWCHICRLCHDKKHQDNAMIKGSRCLKLDNIKNHSTSHYHKENMKRYMEQMSELNPFDSNGLNSFSEENI